MQRIRFAYSAFGALLLALCLIGSRSAQAGEHPSEHPKEHPAEHPTKAAEEMTVEALADAIAAYVAQDAKLKGGFFLVYDAHAKKPLALTLEKVHRERLATLGEGVYFACADFKATDGTVYDLDIFIKSTPHGMTTTEVAVHKEAGAARYNWVEKDGVWSKAPIK